MIVALQSPGDMFANQFGGVIEARLEGFDYRDAGGCIAKPHGQVTQPALVTDASYG